MLFVNPILLGGLMFQYKRVTFDELINFISPENYLDDYIYDSSVYPFHNLGLYDQKSDAVVLDDVIVLPVGIIYKDMWISDEIHYMPKDWKTAHWMAASFENNIYNTPYSFSSDINQLDGDFFYLDDMVGHRNFGHFIHDTCASYSIFNNAKKHFKGMKALFSTNSFENSKWILRNVYCDEPSDVFFYDKKPFKVKKLIVPRRQSELVRYTDDHKWRLPRNSFRMFHERALTLNPNTTNSGYKVFLHRYQKDKSEMNDHELELAQGRFFNNMPDVLKNFADAGYLILEPGKLHQSDLLRLLSGADVVVGVHGAGLANAIFAKNQSTICEIYDANGTWRSLEALFKTLNFDFKSSTFRSNVDRTPISLDLTQVMEL